MLVGIPIVEYIETKKADVRSPSSEYDYAIKVDMLALMFSPENIYT